MTSTILAALLAVAAQAAPDALPAPPPAPTPPAAELLASLQGRVVDKIGGAPSEGVLVLIDADLVATTDADGGFAALDIAPGPHLVSLVGAQGEELHEAI